MTRNLTSKILYDNVLIIPLAKALAGVSRINDLILTAIICPFRDIPSLYSIFMSDMKSSGALMPSSLFLALSVLSLLLAPLLLSYAILLHLRFEEQKKHKKSS